LNEHVSKVCRLSVHPIVNPDRVAGIQRVSYIQRASCSSRVSGERAGLVWGGPPSPSVGTVSMVVIEPGFDLNQRRLYAAMTGVRDDRGGMSNPRKGRGLLNRGVVLKVQTRPD
jgi:hypothetical protein